MLRVDSPIQHVLLSIVNRILIRYHHTSLIATEHVFVVSFSLTKYGYTVI